MKRYRISVNGQSYDVTVEELGGARAPAQAAPVAAAQSAPTASPAPQAAPQAASPSIGSTQVKAPMPGTLVSFKVAKGQAVKAGEVILILEAMKMENEIVAPRDGVVAELRAAPGSTVSAGDVLVEIA